MLELTPSPIKVPMASIPGSMIFRAALIALAVGAWFLMQPDPGYACSCAENGPPAEELENSASVFMGRVVSVREFDRGDGTFSTTDPTTIEFDVQTVWKGPAYGTMYLTTPRSDASCGFAFAEGVTYIVYSRNGSTVSLCSRTRELSRAAYDLAVLGEGDALPGGLAAPTPDLSRHRSGGCGPSPHTADLSIAGLIVCAAWIGGRRQRPDPY